MESNRREGIPAAVKREVRQRCAFGCVMCGAPIYDYEHMQGYSATGHDPRQMTLLCPEHHREKTAGRLPVEEVRRADAAPFNTRRDVDAHMPLYFSGDTFSVDFGEVRFTNTFPDPFGRPTATAIQVDGVELFGVTRVGHRILINANMRDEFNQPVLVVKDGELHLGTTPWDITFEGTTLTVKRGPSDIFLRVRFQPPTLVVVERGEFWLNGIYLRVHPSGVFECVNTGNTLWGFEMIDASPAVTIAPGTRRFPPGGVPGSPLGPTCTARRLRRQTPGNGEGTA